MSLLTATRDPSAPFCTKCEKVILDKTYDECDSVTQANWHLYCKCKPQTKGAEKV